MYLGLKTDNPTAELYLYNLEGTEIAAQQWLADRRLADELLAKLEIFLTDHSTSFDGLEGLFIFQGPGSFTGLRIGMTMFNTIAYAQSISIVATMGDDWVKEAVKRLQKGENDVVALPEYGAPARITLPKK